MKLFVTLNCCNFTLGMNDFSLHILMNVYLFLYLLWVVYACINLCIIFVLKNILLTILFTSNQILTGSVKKLPVPSKIRKPFSYLTARPLPLRLRVFAALPLPFFHHKDIPLLNATRDSVLPNLRSVERRLLKDPEKAETYQAEMSRLLETGAVCVVPDPVPDTSECWYIPHHIVSHNGKCRLVFNCSHQVQRSEP